MVSTRASSPPRDTPERQAGPVSVVTIARSTLWIPLVTVAVVVALTVDVVHGGRVVTLDLRVRNFLSLHYHPLVFHVAERFTEVVSPTVDVIALIVYGLSGGRRRRHAVLAVVAALVVVVLGMKYAVHRPPPYGPRHSRGSFPSGHTASVLICAGSGVLISGLRRWCWAIVALLTTVVAGCLVYNDYHWLSDVVASVAIGVTVLWGLSVTLRASGPRSPS